MCKKHIKCEFNYSFIRSFNHSYIISFFIFAQIISNHWNSFFF